ncbi:MAG: hypothetical protein P8184_21910 [Calditrichia bacterium]
MQWFEIVGYAASVLIAISMAMNSIVRLRLLGLAGSILFSFYGVLIHSVPVALLNGFVAGAHLFYLLQIKGHKEYFEIMTVPNVDTPFLRRFVAFYSRELSHYFPEFSLEKLQKPIILFVFRDMIPAALFIAEPKDRRTLEIMVDYVTPDYRDMRSAHYIFLKGKKLFGNKGFERFITRAHVKMHEKYLQKMNFIPVKLDGENYFEKEI